MSTFTQSLHNSPPSLSPNEARLEPSQGLSNTRVGLSDTHNGIRFQSINNVDNNKPDTEGTERSFCLSGDTDKQKGSALGSADDEDCEKATLQIRDLQYFFDEKSCVTNLF